MSGSINYFVASLDSSETQEKIIEEMNQVRHNYLQESIWHFLAKVSHPA